jgi:hypothetical protein
MYVGTIVLEQWKTTPQLLDSGEGEMPKWQDFPFLLIGVSNKLCPCCAVAFHAHWKRIQKNADGFVTGQHLGPTI